jgi:excisionase family DNA binding protein
LAYTLKEVQELVGINRSSIYLALADHCLRAVKSGKKTLVLAKDLQAWLEKSSGCALCDIRNLRPVTAISKFVPRVLCLNLPIFCSDNDGINGHRQHLFCAEQRCRYGLTASPDRYNRLDSRDNLTEC